MGRPEGNRRSTTAILAAGSLVLLAPSPADAQTGPSITVRDGSELVTDEDGTSSLTITVTVSEVDGPTALSIVVDGTDPSDCTPLVAPVVRPGVESKVRFDLPAGCALPGTADVELLSLPFDSSEWSPSGIRIETEVTTTDGSPDYANLGRGFGFGSVIAVLAVVVAWWLRVGQDMQPGRPGRWSRNPWERLQGLDAKWSWTDSPLSSVTVAAAVFTAVLGATEPLETIVGTGGESQVAVIVVAAALATALTAAAPLALALLRDEDPDFFLGAIPNNYTVLGVLVATTAVLAGSLGLILTVVWTLWDASSISHAALLPSALLVGSLVVAYTVRSLRRTLKIGKARDDLSGGAAIGAMP